MSADNPLTAAEEFAESVDPFEVPCPRLHCGAAEGKLCRYRESRCHDERWHVAIALKLERLDVNWLPVTETIEVGETLVSFAKRDVGRDRDAP
jgi:hypothetical protein